MRHGDVLDLLSCGHREWKKLVDQRFRLHSFVEEPRTGNFVCHLDCCVQGQWSTSAAVLKSADVYMLTREELLDRVTEEIVKANAELQAFVSQEGEQGGA